MSLIEVFQEEHPSLDSYWRSIILFGRNVASYKFALAKSLLEITTTGKTVLTLEELAVPFSRNLCEHLFNSPKQATSDTSQFLDVCKKFNDGAATHDQLIETTVAKGFNNVIDAFHTVNNDPVPVKFYEKDYYRSIKKLILTDDVYKLHEIQYAGNLIHEAEARWNLVETAWDLGVSRNLLNVSYDDITKVLFIDNKLRRKDVTSARDALNGYQKGKCFYCYKDITVDKTMDEFCEVDHFFPHILQPTTPWTNIDGVWNLVLACPECNRGADGKFSRVPAIKYLERLSKRNEFLINSHHPLKETLIQQTGTTAEERHIFLRAMDRHSINRLIHRWETEQVGEEVF